MLLHAAEWGPKLQEDRAPLFTNSRYASLHLAADLHPLSHPFIHW